MVTRKVIVKKLMYAQSDLKDAIKSIKGGMTNSNSKIWQVINDLQEVTGDMDRMDD